MEKPGYKRVENDTEFLERIRKTHSWWSPWSTRDLDEDAWRELKMQRRIIEVFP